MPEVCNKVAIEPHLQPVTSEEISCASQHPGWYFSTPRMVPLNTQDGATQHPGWCHSTTRMVPLNTQDGASQHPGWCLSIPRMVPLNTQDGTPASTQDGTSTSTSDGTRLDVAAYNFWASRIERVFLNPILTSRISNPNCCLVTGSLIISRMGCMIRGYRR